MQATALVLKTKFTTNHKIYTHTNFFLKTSSSQTDNYHKNSNIIHTLV